MQKLARNKKGLSTVITTLIILVVAVLLAGVVTYYATNVVMTRTTMEEVRIRKPHVWVQEGDNAYAALMVQNLGGRDILIDKITIRGVEAPWGGGFSEDIDIGVAGFVYGSTGATPPGLGAPLINTPIAVGSITITATVSGSPVTITDALAGTGYPDGELTGASVTGTMDYESGEWTLDWGAGPGPDVGTPITASYSLEGAVYVKYYLVQSGDDVSSDFELKVTSGVVYPKVGTVPDKADWAIPMSDMPLKSSGTMLFFITNPTNIALNDVGTTISMTVYTSNAQWIVETNVQAAEIIPVA